MAGRSRRRSVRTSNEAINSSHSWGKMWKDSSCNSEKRRKEAKWLIVFMLLSSLSCRPTVTAAATITTPTSERVTGDLETTPDSQDGLFGDMDGDNNGRISIDEIREFVVDTGGNALDDNKEIQNAVHNVLFALDGNVVATKLSVTTLSPSGSTSANVCTSKTSASLTFNSS